MPCSDGGYGRDDCSDERRQSSQRAAQITKLESLLCSACRVLDKNKFDFDTNPALSEWWDKHQKADQKRADAERLAAQKIAYEKRVLGEALKKKISDLSPEEKNLLKKHNFL